MPFEPGHRRLGGRAKGTPNKASVARQAQVEASGQTPLEFMLTMMRDESASREDRKWAAEHAAPYVHPRLASTTTSNEGVPDWRAWLLSLGDPDRRTPES
jgi:hypothetical protein